MKQPRIIHMLIIAAAALLVYSNTFHVPFHFDDETNIVKNPLIQNSQNLFHPSQYCSQVSAFSEEENTCKLFRTRYVGYLSFALNYRLNGLDVAGYHMLNLAVHILNGFLVYLLVYLTFRTPFFSGFSVRDHAQVIALFSSLLFITHPVQTQAVTYIVQRFASLAAMFYLLSAVLYLRFRLLQVNTEYRGSDTEKTQNSTGGKSVFFYLTSLICAAAAMKTKEIAFTLPFIIMLYELIFFSGKMRRRVLSLMPFFLTLLIIPLSLISTGQSPGTLLSSMGEATRLYTTVSRWEYLITEFRVIVTYFRLLVFPVDQNLDYDYPIYHSFSDPEVFLSFLFLLSIGLSGIYLFCRYRNTYPYSRLVAFGIFWFFITISIESSIIPIVDVIFEHRLYLPSAGLFISFTAGLYGLTDTYRERWKAGGKAVAVLCICITVAFAGTAYLRNEVWQNHIRLWEDIAGKSPHKARVYYTLANYYGHARQYDRAIAMYHRATALDPMYFEAYNNLGNLFWKLGQYENAVYYLSAAIALNAYSDKMLDNRARLYFVMGQYDKAIADFTRALTINPNIRSYHKNRGRAYAQGKQYSAAIHDFTSALRIGPDDPEIYALRGMAYSLLGDALNASPDFQKACSMGYRQACDALGQYAR